jgi:hypothetical protein
MEFEGYTKDQVGHHIYLMHQAGLLEAHPTKAMHQVTPIAIPIAMTWQGHEATQAAIARLFGAFRRLHAHPDRPRRYTTNPFTPTTDFIEEKMRVLPRSAILF